jgi:hypothetical protein
MPVILAPWEAEIGKIAIPGPPRHKVYEIPISINIWEQWRTLVIPSYVGG